jgi:segregation and condensation protein B
MEIGNLIPHIEALIFASDKPLTALELTELINNAFGFMEDKIVLDQIESSLEGVVEKYKSEFYPFEIREAGGGWQFLTKKDYHKTVAQLNGDKFLKRLSTAALEALSIIAYKQPVTKSDIEAIRGVSSDYAIQKLLEKELVIITGRNEALPGHPLVYCTSKTFMDYFGINTADDLPKLKEVFDEAMINATSVSESAMQQEAERNAEEGRTDTEEEVTIVVGPDGELVEVATEEETTTDHEGHINGTAVDFVEEATEEGEEEEEAGEEETEEAETETEGEEETDEEDQEEEEDATADEEGEEENEAEAETDEEGEVAEEDGEDEENDENSEEEEDDEAYEQEQNEEGADGDDEEKDEDSKEKQ